jgi:hypothetical protein
MLCELELTESLYLQLSRSGVESGDALSGHRPFQIMTLVTPLLSMIIACYICFQGQISAFVMPLLHSGRRRTKLDRKYNGPPRQGPVRHISPAQLNLERVYEQNRVNVQKRDAAKLPEPAPGAAAKGKPRLLLMGQRR